MSLLTPILAFFGLKARATSSPPTITPVAPDLLREIDEQADLGLAFVRRHAGADAAATPDNIDRAIVVWRARPDGDRQTSDSVLEQVGALFGNYLVGKLGLEWAICSDERGDDLCVIHKKVSVFSFPIAAIDKAISGREQALPKVEAALIKQISEALDDPMIQTR